MTDFAQDIVDKASADLDAVAKGIGQTNITFLLDRSGSMHRIVEDVIGGVNTFLSEQAADEGKCTIKLVLFDSHGVDTLFDGDIQDAPDLTLETYVPRGGTPLLDAIGKTIAGVKALPGRQLFVVYTDGEENQSREYTNVDIKRLVADKSAAGWDFIFLGADIDAYGVAGMLGFGAHQIHNTNAHNVGGVMTAMSASTSSYRQGASYVSATAALDEVDADVVSGA